MIKLSLRWPLKVPRSLTRMSTFHSLVKMIIACRILSVDCGTRCRQGMFRGRLAATRSWISEQHQRNQRVTGWGVSVSGALRPREPVRLYAQFAFGEGFARYIEDLDGISSDAALDANGDLVALSTIGAFAGWNHRWTESLQSNLIYGFACVSNSAGQAPDAFHQSEYVSGNVIWSPLTNLDLGCEALWGNRQDKSRSVGEAVRLQFTTTLPLLS
jgi:hypothetical protein